MRRSVSLVSKHDHMSSTTVDEDALFSRSSMAAMATDCVYYADRAEMTYTNDLQGTKRRSTGKHSAATCFFTLDRTTQIFKMHAHSPL